MKPIKKFSMMSKAEGSINESADVNHDAVMDLVKKMGYESVEELKKEKNLLTKLEGLLKDVSPKDDISEDELEEDRAEDIADEVKKKGEPKSLESEEDKDDDKVSAEGEVAETDEVEEDAAKEIEDEVLAKGEPKDVEDKAGDKVSDDPEITDEVPAEADEVEDEKGVEVAAEEEETPAATKRIMAFEDFIKEKEVTINKNVKYHDDDEEKEDYSVVAAAAKPLAEDDDEDEGEDDEKKGDELEDKGDKKVDSEDDKEKADHYKGAVKSDDSEIDALKKDAEYDEEEEKKDESRIMSFSNFVTESYDEEEVEEEEEIEAEEEGVKETFTFADAVDTAGEDVKKNEKGIASALKALKARKADDISIMTDTTEDDGLYDAIEGMKTLPIDSTIYDKAYTGKYKGKDVVVFNDGDDLFAYVKEGVGEVITKVTGDEIADEEAGDDGLAIPAEKGDGSETAAGIAGDIMDMGKVKVQPESKGEELVTKDQNITTEVKGEGDDLKDATEVPAKMGDGSESAAGIAGDIMNMGKVKVQPEAKGAALVGEAKINEKDITSADEFKEYAMAILKDAFGDDFDETKATETADGLIKKYGEDYGAMVGALQSTMGS